MPEQGGGAGGGGGEVGPLDRQLLMADDFQFQVLSRAMTSIINRLELQCKVLKQ